MNWIDRSALRIALSIRNNYKDAASERVLFYALSLLINSAFATFIVLGISLITNQVVSAIITLISFSVIRTISGGLHLKSSLACSITTILFLTMIIHVEYQFTYLGAIINFISMIILLIEAPKGIEHVSRISPKHYPILKILCVCFVLSNFFLQSSLLSSVFLFQALTLTNFTYKIANRLEGRWVREEQTCKNS
ncbi:accessory gene regulator ArgB-like protein [Paenibacillus sp. S-38]|uniref:accessory gene regulator ArgB-like protein n=1 Tax=Paenibacillus sp. S-38 TaxID=3416710 RepID=UPI003CF6BBD1